MKPSFGEGVALVSGGSGGIGSAVVRLLAACDLSVAFTYRSGKDAAERLLAEVGAPDRVRAFNWASSTSEDASELVRQVDNELGPIRFLVAAAGVGQESAFHTLGEADWSRIIDTNLISVIALSRALVTPMLKAGAPLQPCARLIQPPPSRAPWSRSDHASIRGGISALAATGR